MTHLVESRNLFFLEAKIVDNIFQWDVLKNMQQIKSYDDMFQAIKTLTIQKILKIRIFSPKLLQNGNFFLFSVKRFDSNYTPSKIQPYTSHGIIRTALNILFRGKLSMF